MKKIGFIDYYIDEWHANNYPAMIRKSSFKDKFDVVLSWEEIALDGKKNIDKWCKEQKIEKASSIEEIVDKCDYLVVLSPDNSERHEDLADLPLRSGKPVYIDKPIAPSLAAARRLFSKAEMYGTPIMSCSALRFGSAIDIMIREKIAGLPVQFATAKGGGDFHIYAIHQLEMIVMLLGTGAQRVIQCGNDASQLMIIDYGDIRRGVINLIPNHPYQISVQYGDGQSLAINSINDHFPRFIESMLIFFETGKSLVPKEQTLEIAALIEAGNAALECPDVWVTLPVICQEDIKH